MAIYIFLSLVFRINYIDAIPSFLVFRINYIDDIPSFHRLRPYIIVTLGLPLTLLTLICPVVTMFYNAPLFVK